MSNKWISVNERLPDKSGSYLVCGISLKPQIVRFDCFENSTLNLHKRWRYKTYGSITHWRHLPEPPVFKSVLISINPQWCELIASGKKTVEVRKTKPKTNMPFKCYIYCTKKGVPNRWLDETKHGRVIGEFVCNKIDYWQYHWLPDVMHIEEMSRLSCVSTTELLNYLGDSYDMHGKNKRLYAWHISNFVIYDEPKELNEFSKYGFGHPAPLKRPPQSWCYVEVLK